MCVYVSLLGAPKWWVSSWFPFATLCNPLKARAPTPWEVMGFTQSRQEGQGDRAGARKEAEEAEAAAAGQGRAAVLDHLPMTGGWVSS